MRDPVVASCAGQRRQPAQHKAQCSAHRLQFSGPCSDCTCVGASLYLRGCIIVPAWVHHCTCVGAACWCILTAPHQQQQPDTAGVHPDTDTASAAAPCNPLHHLPWRTHCLLQLPRATPCRPRGSLTTHSYPSTRPSQQMPSTPAPLQPATMHCSRHRQVLCACILVVALSTRTSNGALRHISHRQALLVVESGT
jgi:hypothetical protein